MKKSVLALAMAFGVTGAFAQDLTSKKGEPYLPEAGDWSIGIDATPFLNYAGQMLSNAGASSPSFNFLTANQSIVGKMFKDEKTAYRGGLRIGFGGTKTINKVDTRYADPAAAPSSYSFPSEAPMVENTRKVSNRNIALSGGIEMRRGKTRLQGYYGGELGIGISGTSKKYEYGNSLVAPTSTTPGITVDSDDSFGDGNVVAVGTPVSQGQIGDARITQQKGGGTFSIGLRGFIGAEYFILPKMSIAGEFGWGLALNKTGAMKTTYETTGMSSGATAQSTGSIEVETTKSGNWSLDTDNKNSVFGPAASLRLNLHF
jgi:hypothetical protein